MATSKQQSLSQGALAQVANMLQTQNTQNLATVTGTITLGNTAPGGSSIPAPNDSGAEADKQNRRAVERPQWRDLEVGDKFTYANDTFEVTRITRDRIYHASSKGEGYEARSANSITYPVELMPSLSSKKVNFESVILPDEKKQQILDAIKQIDNHDLIFKEWGFEDTFEKGTAISLLFFGPPGTGKTLMAQAIADRFDYKLKIVSTADIETPEPGGAERNIQKAFRGADKKTVLLFDECDSLISSRKHMGSILAAQVNALLTELEQFTGIVIFTTNRVETLDEAFDRRLSLKLEFEMPNEEHRAQIWARMFPMKAPLHKDVDFKKLATVEIAGGHIKNIVLRAARAAANLDMPNQDKQITQAILFDALKKEARSMVAFSDAKQNEPFYGTPTMNRGKGRLEINRG